jgi:hypothetical protein
MNYN